MNVKSAFFDGFIEEEVWTTPRIYWSYTSEFYF